MNVWDVCFKTFLAVIVYIYSQGTCRLLSFNAYRNTGLLDTIKVLFCPVL